MLDFISNCKQTIIKYKKQFFSFAFFFLFFFNFSLSGSAATTLIGDGADGTITFNMLEQSGTHLNRGGSITKDGYLSIDLTNQTQYGAGGGVVSVMSSSKIDVTDVNKLSLSCSIVSLPSDVSFSDLYFNFGLTNTNDGFPLNYIAGSGNSAFPTLVYGLSEIKGISFPIEFTISDVVGDYYITFGFSCPYISSNPRCILKFSDLILYDSAGDVVGVIDIIDAIEKQTDSIMNAGSEFSGTTSGILSGNEVLSGFIDDYTEVEQSMYDKFTENQTAVSGNFSGWSWGSLSTAVDWTSDYLNRIYDNSGDFRTMFMYPILSGIALIFIGRQGLTAYVRSRREK